jgi:hypothetical protein
MYLCPTLRRNSINPRVTTNATRSAHFHYYQFPSQVSFSRKTSVGDKYYSVENFNGLSVTNRGSRKAAETNFIEQVWTTPIISDHATRLHWLSLKTFISRLPWNVKLDLMQWSLSNKYVRWPQTNAILNLIRGCIKVYMEHIKCFPRKRAENLMVENLSY